MLRMDQLTIKSQEVLQKAQQIAQTHAHQELTDSHILCGLLDVADTAIHPLLQKLGINPSSLANDVKKVLEKLPKVSSVTQQYLSQIVTDIFEASQKEAHKLLDDYVSCEHILMALVDHSGEAGRLLKQHGVTKEHLLKALQEVRGSARVDSQEPEATYQVIKKFTVDLIDKAKKGHLDPVIGRDEEIRRVIQVLCRRTKNNPVLIGEPGVGKTAIAEGLAQRIVSGDVPELLRHSQLLSLDMGSLIAGAKYRGEFEDRLKGLLREIQKQKDHVILFIDELHTMVGAGASEGAVDAANMLKPALARGELRCIGATTLNEYRKYIEKDTALERRFQKVFVGEPSVADTIAILRGLKEKYEVHHGVKIRDEAILAAARLSHRYIADRFLPDKAIDLVDEAASKLRIEIDSMPEEIDDVERKIIQLEIEKQAIIRDTSKAAKHQLDTLEGQLVALKETATQLKIHWQNEKTIIQSIRDTKSKIEEAKALEQAEERKGNYEKVSEIRFKILPELQEKTIALSENLAKIQTTKKMLKEEVDDEDIADIVAKWTGIPVARLIRGEKERLLHTEESLHKRVIGQDHAIQKVAEAVRRSRSGLSDPNRPIGSFIFLGPTGVGKTELAKALAEFLFDSEKNIIRIDMSEYMEKHSVARLIGAPPGYVGYEEGGQLSESVRRRPYSVVLLDEIEKAHPDVYNVLLQVLDDGRLTDGQGQTVDFKNTILIMTSNLGGQVIQSEPDVQKQEQLVWDTLKAYFKPEFLNRIEDVVIFRPLEITQLAAIVDIQLEALKTRLNEKNMQLVVTDALKNYIALKGFDPDFGARPLKRTITHLLQNPLAKQILEGKFEEGDTIVADYQNDSVLLNKA